MSGNNRNIKMFFPMTRDKTIFRKVKFDRESLHYISKRNDAEIITGIIIKHLQEFNINPKNAVITDAMAGIGGNTISFGMMFKYVHSIEVNNIWYDCLKNNTSIYNLKNIFTYNKDCLDVIPNILDHDVMFLDPPWGGKNYKKIINMKIVVSNVELEDLCLSIFSSTKMKKCPSLVVLKLPLNYNIKHFFNKLNDKQRSVLLYTLEKMYIVVIKNNIQ